MERFQLSDVQAQAICDMRLIALQGLNREKLEAEYRELEAYISLLEQLYRSHDRRSLHLRTGRCLYQRNP